MKKKIVVLLLAIALVVAVLITLLSVSFLDSEPIVVYTQENNIVTEEVDDSLTSVVIEVDEITDDLLASLEEQGLVIDDYEKSDVYGNFISGTINEDEIENLENYGDVNDGITKDQYKTEILTEIVLDYDSSLGSNQDELEGLVESQIWMEEQREEAGVDVGPWIDSLLIEKLEEEELVPVYMYFRIEEWDSWEKYVAEIESELDDNIVIDKSGAAGITGYLTKDGLLKLENKDSILRITYRLE